MSFLYSSTDFSAERSISPEPFDLDTFLQMSGSDMSFEIQAAFQEAVQESGGDFRQIQKSMGPRPGFPSLERSRPRLS